MPQSWDMGDRFFYFPSGGRHAEDFYVRKIQSKLGARGQHANHQTTAPKPSTTGKDPVPIVYEAGWAPGPVWTGAGNLTSTAIRSPDRPASSESLYGLSYHGFDNEYSKYTLQGQRKQFDCIQQCVLRDSFYRPSSGMKVHYLKQLKVIKNVLQFARSRKFQHGN